jgi:hypothetical protein
MANDEFQIEVSCYAGYRYPERPLSFKLLGRIFDIEEILDRWHGEDYMIFKIRAADQRVYLLKYNLAEDHWFLEGLVHSSLRPEITP